MDIWSQTLLVLCCASVWSICFSLENCPLEKTSVLLTHKYFKEWCVDGSQDSTPIITKCVLNGTSIDYSVCINAQDAKILLRTTTNLTPDDCKSLARAYRSSPSFFNGKHVSCKDGSKLGIFPYRMHQINYFQQSFGLRNRGRGPPFRRSVQNYFLSESEELEYYSELKELRNKWETSTLNVLDVCKKITYAPENIYMRLPLWKIVFACTPSRSLGYWGCINSALNKCMPASEAIKMSPNFSIHTCKQLASDTMNSSIQNLYTEEACWPWFQQPAITTKLLSTTSLPDEGLNKDVES